MTTTEGVIKYELDFQPAEPLPAAEVARLNAWRTLMQRIGVIGQDATRYGGYGYGNISCRRRRAPREFIITASQTGHQAELTVADYCLVQAADITANRIVARGPRPPSSEALTHAVLYQHDPAIRAVIHGHCPEIWQQAAALNIPATPDSVPYGTPALAIEIQRLFAETHVARRKILAMGGHTDGVVSFGTSLAHSAGSMLRALAAALRLAPLH